MTESTIIFFLTKLSDRDRRDEYEQWVREVDMPTVKSWSSTIDYRVVRLEEAALEGVATPDYDYIEIMEVTSVKDYQAIVAEAPASLFEAFGSHIGPFQAVAGKAVR